jgi:hypothetical protein
MSYVFSGKIQSAMFVNPPQNSTIELLYGEGNELTAFHLDVDYSNQEFLDFIEEWPLEKIENDSRMQSRLLLNEHIKFIDKEITLRSLDGTRAIDYILKNNNDKDAIFDIKLNLLKTITTVASKKNKMRMRKATSLFELFAIYYEMQ